MSSFAIGAMILTLIALCLVALPLFLKRQKRQQITLTNTHIVKQRLAELEQEQSEGLLSEQDKQQAIEELKLALLNEQQDKQQHAVSERLLLPLCVGAAIALIGGGLVYYHSSEIGKVAHWQASMERLPELSRRIVVEGDQSIQQADLEDFALGIRSKLIEDPSDPTGWLLLGRLYSSLNRLDSALEAFQKSLSIKPDHLGTLTSYSQALMVAAQASGDEIYLHEAMSILQRLTSLAPDDVNALGMSAVVATRLGDNEQAIFNWQKLQRMLPADSPMIADIQQRIALLGGPSAAPEVSPETEQDGSGKSVEIAVSLAPELQEKLPSSGYLFVFAQDASGAVRMPAAVVKTPLGKLPVQIELSDRNAMMESYRLSNLEQTRLVARISIDGNVAQAAGELQGEIVVELKPGKNSLQHIVINKELM